MDKASDEDRNASDGDFHPTVRKFRQLADWAPVSMAIFDHDMRYLELTQGWRDACHIGNRDLIGLSHYEIFPELPQQWKDVHRRCLEGATERSESDLFVRPDGTRGWIRWEVKPWRDDSGNIGGIVMWSEDITARKEAEGIVQDSERRFKTALANSHVAVWEQDLQLRYTWIYNPKLGYETDAVIGKTDSELMAPAYAKELEAIKRRVIETRQATRQEVVTAAPNGRAEFYDLSVEPLLNDFGDIVGITCAAADITERKRAEERLQLAASVFRHTHEGIVVTDTQGTITEVNDAFTRITGYSRAEVLGRNMRILHSGKQDNVFYARMWDELARTGGWRGEIWNRRKDGELYPELLDISVVPSEKGEVKSYVGVFTDISKFKAHESQLEMLAHFDALTGLPNRLLAADRLQQAMANARRTGQGVAVVFIDLDGFKDVNDKYGHPAGDQMLIAVARNMQHILREGDTLARIGGDEFVVVLVNMGDLKTCAPLLDRLIDAAAQSIVFNGHLLNVTASLGVTWYPQGQEVVAEQLLRQADQAMYRAKIAGKNRYRVFDAVEDSSIRGWHEELEHIERALHQGEFVLHYQPKVNLLTGQMLGVEALIRWEHPNKGLLAPAAFLPVIDEHALAIDIGEWVIDTALSQIETWQSQGLNVPISVNVGALQLQQTNFVSRLGALLDRHPGVAPKDLTLEILETNAVQDITYVAKVIEDCRKMGVTFALDDFGTGYSSLTYLKHLRVAELKIDQSFVRGMLGDEDNLPILNGIMGMAKAFNHQVIAEGVETVKHGTMLLELGCERAQGYAIARPMPADELPAWASAWQPPTAWCKQPAS
jgi:diguanylate cyclase (GGDEF)-like protein/PAS domain S-box-containing protein